MIAQNDPATACTPRQFKLRIEDYALLDHAGSFEHQRVELIDGRIIALPAQFMAHALVKSQLGYRFQTALDLAELPYEAVVGASLALSQHDLPEADILVGPVSIERDYFRIGDTMMVVEVSDTSVRYDLGKKRELYAVSRVPEYWVVDVNARQVHQFWNAGSGSYAESRTVPLDGALRSMTIPDLAIDGGGIL